MTEKCFEERFRDVEENYKVITNRIAEAAVRSGRKPEDVTFLAATKTVPAEVINHAIGCGLRFIGENRVQEFMDKYEKIDWDKGVSGQIIGRLQTNKVKGRLHPVGGFRKACKGNFPPCGENRPQNAGAH